MYTCDKQRRDWIMECERVARLLQIKTRVTRNSVSFEFPDRTRRKEAAKRRAVTNA